MLCITMSAVSSARIALPTRIRRVSRLVVSRPVRERVAVARNSQGGSTESLTAASLEISQGIPGLQGSQDAKPASMDARALLPPDYALHRTYEPQKITEISRYWAMPNLRPMKESSDGCLVFLKVCSFAILGVTFGTVIAHNIQLKKEDQESGRVPDVEISDYFGYGFGYGCKYGYRYGYGYGHAYGDEEFVSNRSAFSNISDDSSSSSKKEKWSESQNPVKNTAGKVVIGLKGVWEAIPA